jgi:hypothetical protein
MVMLPYFVFDFAGQRRRNARIRLAMHIRAKYCGSEKEIAVQAG